MRIVITGGLGMLGVELARHLRSTRPRDELLLLDVPAAAAPPDDLAHALGQRQSAPGDDGRALGLRAHHLYRHERVALARRPRLLAQARHGGVVAAAREPSHERDGLLA